MWGRCVCEKGGSGILLGLGAPLALVAGALNGAVRLLSLPIAHTHTHTHTLSHPVFAGAPGPGDEGVRVRQVSGGAVGGIIYVCGLCGDVSGFGGANVWRRAFPSGLLHTTKTSYLATLIHAQNILNLPSCTALCRDLFSAAMRCQN